MATRSSLSWGSAGVRPERAAARRTHRRAVGGKTHETISLLQRIAEERGLTLLFTEQ